ncbi:MAG: class I SAM-dependent methyltransferase [Cellvibrionaceae bacterium]
MTSILEALKGFLDRQPEHHDEDINKVAADSQRIFHGRGGHFPGMEWCCIDYFHPVFLITCFNQPSKQVINEISDFLFSQAPWSCVVVQSRFLPKSPIDVIKGKLPDIVCAQRRDLKFLLSFNQQNVGYFLDIEPGRQWLEEKVKNKKVLNLFSFTCVFSVIAREAGAREIVNIDMSKKGLSTGRDNHRLNNHDLAGIQFLGMDIMKSWSRIRKHGPYDLIIIDPPSYQKGSFIASRDYGKVIRRIKEFAAFNAEILLCLNDPKTSPQFLMDLVNTEAPDLLFQQRLPTDPNFPDVSKDAALKLMLYRMP